LNSDVKPWSLSIALQSDAPNKAFWRSEQLLWSRQKDLVSVSPASANPRSHDAHDLVLGRQTHDGAGGSE
jgi:hypothetical protein